MISEQGVTPLFVMEEGGGVTPQNETKGRTKTTIYLEH